MDYNTLIKLVKSECDATFTEDEMDFRHIITLIDSISANCPVHLAIMVANDVLADYALIQSGEKNHW